MSSSIPSGPRKTRTRVSHEHTLERVRENQRRHRARRRDHIATLEQKLQEAERQLAEARADIEALKRERDGGVWGNGDAVTKRGSTRDSAGGKREFERPHESAMNTEVQAEKDGGSEEQSNRESNTLLSPSSQLTPANSGTIYPLQPQPGHRYHISSSEATINGSILTLLPPLQTSDSELLTNLPSPLMSVYSPTVSVPNSPSPTLGATNGPIHTAAATCQPLCCETEKEEERTMSNVTASSLDCDCPSTALPPSNPSESTTLCSQAYILIAQQNYRGIEGDTIRRWLWEGFRAGQGRGEGCRVENGALFSLLDFISGV